MRDMEEIRNAVTICLVPEARLGPFVFHGNLEDGCAWAATMGFNAVEVFPGHADDLNGRDLRSLLQRHGLQLAAVGTGAGWVRQRLSLTDPDPRIRAHAEDFIGAIVDFAGGFGAPAILGSMQGRVPDGVNREEALGWLAAGLEQLAPRAYAFGVPFLYEPLNRYETNLFNTVGAALEFLETLRTKNVRLLLDLFHMNIEETDLAEAIRHAGTFIGHVHWADSNRRAMGMGHTDASRIADALKEVGYRGYISAEVFPLPDREGAARQTLKSWGAHFGPSAGGAKAS